MNNPRHQYPLTLNRRFGVLTCRAFALLLCLIGRPTAATDSVQSATLQRMIAEAQPGDVIVVEGPRTFYESVVIDKPVRLVGKNRPVIDGQGRGTTLAIYAADVEVRGFVIRGSGSDLARFDSTVLIRAPRATLAQCRIETDAFGIYLRAADDCRIQSNLLVGSTNQPASKRGNGVHLWKSARNHIAGNSISHLRDGIYLSYADHNVVVSNRVAQTRFGLHSMYSHQNRLTGNELTDNVVGAALMFSRGTRVEGNRAYANRRHGLLLKQVENSQIAGNFISVHNRGLFVQQAVQNRFEGNLIRENDIGLYLSGGSEENVFVRNSFLRNIDQVWQPIEEADRGRHASNQFFENGCGNYWSDYSGTDAHGDGIGDTPYHETDVFGYLLDRHPEARLFALSPAVALLRKGEKLMPLLDLAGVADLFPLVNPPRSYLPKALPPDGQTELATPASQTGSMPFDLQSTPSRAHLFSNLPSRQ